jgi:hypothetical protein
MNVMVLFANAGHVAVTAGMVGDIGPSMGGAPEPAIGGIMPLMPPVPPIGGIVPPMPAIGGGGVVGGVVPGGVGVVVVPVEGGGVVVPVPVGGGVVTPPGCIGVIVLPVGEPTVELLSSSSGPVAAAQPWIASRARAAATFSA